MALIPRSIKFATIVGMGLQVALYGMFSVNMVVSQPLTLVSLGDIYSYEVWLTILGLIGIGSLLYHRIPGSLVVGIVVLTIIDNVIKQTVPSQFFLIPNIIEQTANQSDYIVLKGLDFTKVWPAILSLVFVGVIDVSGVIFGIASLAKIPFINGDIPGSTSTFVATSLSTLLSAFTGSSPTIVFIESVACVKEGGRTGLTAVFISLFFIIAMFFSPILSEIPFVATAPVSIIIGAMMMSQAVEINWNQMNEAIPAFLTMVVMPFTFSITNGIAIGLFASFVFYFTTGQVYSDVLKLLYQSPSSSSLLSPTLSSSTSYYAIPNSDIEAKPTDESTPLKSDPTTTTSSSTSAYTTSSYNYYDNQPFVRIPNLLLSESDSEELRRASRKA